MLPLQLIPGRSLNVPSCLKSVAANCIYLSALLLSTLVHVIQYAFVDFPGFSLESHKRKTFEYAIKITARDTGRSLGSYNPFLGYRFSIATIFACLD